MFLTEYPFWLSFICILLAFAGSWFLYRNNPLKLDGRWKKQLNWALFAFRFFVLFILSFLLLGPLLNLVSTKTQKPIIVYAIDNSQSILLGHDAVSLKETFSKHFEKIQTDLGSDYEVVPYLMGSNLSIGANPSFSDKESHLSGLFSALKDKYDNSNLGGIILATDGLYNKGENPLQTVKQIKAPIYPIALGDTIQRKDVLIRNVRTNNIVFKGNTFPIQIDVAAYAAEGESALLQVSKNGIVIFKQPITLGANYFNTINANITATENGTQHYIVSLSALKNEVSLANNNKDVFIQVVDGKQQIGLLGYTPHPDISALQRSIQQNENYAVKSAIFSQGETIDNPNQYNLVILHQLPGINGEGVNLIKQLKEMNIPLLYVIGAQTNLAYLNQLEPLIQIGGYRGAVNETTPLVQDNFSLFTLTDDEKEVIKKFPPLSSPFGSYRITGEIEVLLKQQIGYVKTDFPLLFFSKGGNGRSGFLFGEGFWKWSLHDMGLSNQHTSATLINSSIQYLTSKKDQNKLRLSGKKVFDENEEILFDAELYNESYQLINNPELNILISSTTGKDYKFSFTKTAQAYTLNAGVFPSGVYNYTATCFVGTAERKVTGQFMVKPLQAEFIQTTANHQLLNQLANESGGKLFHLTNLNEMNQSIKQNPLIKPIIYQNNELRSWIDLKWLFMLIMVVLSLEWFVRKWNGSI
ncbi:MAG: hypothetical protein EAY81_07190 [Bacteroidetes bacterium]|nr:MAG: hypothetical protein EAY81_07190 [Bacteroidota bacterium]